LEPVEKLGFADVQPGTNAPCPSTHSVATATEWVGNHKPQPAPLNSVFEQALRLVVAAEFELGMSLQAANAAIAESLSAGIEFRLKSFTEKE
jgi:hypothetical protein